MSTPAGNSTFKVETEVDYSEDVTDPSLGASKDIRITVSWTTPRPGSVTVESNIAGAPAVTNAGAGIPVQDSDTSDPVAGAVITIKPAGGFSASKTTGSDGYAKWKRVATGSIIITGTCGTHYLDLTPVSGAIINNKETLAVTIEGERASSGTFTWSTRTATIWPVWRSPSTALPVDPAGVVPQGVARRLRVLTATPYSRSFAKAITRLPAC